MAKARKEGKQKRNRANLAKRIKLIDKNTQLLNKFKETAQDRLLVTARECFIRNQKHFQKNRRACLWQAFFVSLQYGQKKTPFHIKGNQNQGSTSN